MPVNEFRAALEEYLAGRLDPAGAQARISAAVARAPHLAAAMLATIEALRQSGRIAPNVAASVEALVRAAAKSSAGSPQAPPPQTQPPVGEDKTHFRGTPGAAPAAPPAAGTPPPPADKTQFRPAGAQPPAQPPAGAATAADKTQFRPQGGGADKTQFRPLGTPGAAADQSRPQDPHHPPTSSRTSQSRPTSTGVGGTSSQSWTDIERMASTPTEKLSIGSVLKDRYVLESIVAGGDRGGMGVVYKARDLRAEEVQDRHPYVAIKVLNEDFKRHPESIKALQRESRKAQTLSHPNIITVYIFDRDRGHVFMAMELLEGTPLNDLIKNNRSEGGLPVPEALRIIQLLASALAHAHAHGIVHSDFKPGNAFLTKDNNVKVLDFGIARAAKVKGGDSEKTLFDAGSLGALTMPYASCEQIEGKEPDPADDVYALGVVSYELLTGRHPYERSSADKQGQMEKTDAVSARTARLKPAPVRGLTRRQWRTLQNALAFDRNVRPPTAAEFLEGIRPQKRPIAAMISAAIVVLVLIAVAVLLVPPYLERSRLAKLTEHLQSSDAAVVATALEQLRKYPAETRSTVLVNGAVQSNLFSYFDKRAHQAFDVDAGRYDFKGALAVLKDAQGLSKAYEDSRQLSDYIDQLQSARKTEILRQAEHFETLLKNGQLIPSQGADNVQHTLGVIAQLEPAHPLLNDKRLPIAYADQTRLALDAGKAGLAADLLGAGLQLAPRDVNLLDLQDRVNRQRSAAQLAAQIGQLEKGTAVLTGSGARLQDFRTQRDVIAQLQRAAPNSSVLSAAQDRLQGLLRAEVSLAVQQRQVSGVQSLLGEFSDLVPEKFLDEQRAAIGRVVGEAQARQNAADQLRAAIAKLVSAPSIEDSWITQLQRNLQNLESLAGKDDPAARDARQKTSQAFLAQAQKLRADRRLTEAERVLGLARDFGLNPEQFTAENTALAQAHTQLDTENKARAALAQVAAVKQRILDQALADHIDVAESMFADLQKQLPPGDSFATTDAPRALGNAYLARAQKSASQGRFDDAVQSATAAQRAAPRLPEFQIALQRLQATRDLAAALATAPDLSAYKATLEKLRGNDRAGFAPFESGLVRLVADRLSRLGARDPAAALQLRAGAVQLFPNYTLPNFQVAKAAPAPAPAPVPAAPSPGPAPAAPTVTGGPGPAPAATESTGAGGAAPAIQPAAVPAPAPAAAPVAGPAQVASTTGAAATAPVSLRPCTAALAGLGQNPRASCRDALASGGRGPELVIIPAGEGLAMYGIMRNETSVAEYAAYCAANGCTAPAGATPEVPITTVSVADAEKFAAWLSATTGAKYRLPSDTEWHRAAGKFQDTKANCLVSVNGQAIRGTALRPADIGDLNAFGLRHVVGNAQEWARSDAGGWKALGGAIGDSIDVCSTDLARAHNGQPDGRTGFRLVREMR